jgi:hypothetical protein
MTTKIKWEFNEIPDYTIDTAILEKYIFLLKSEKPQTSMDYARILQVRESLIWHWEESPVIMKKSKFWKRKTLWFWHKYILPFLEAGEADLSLEHLFKK